MKSVRNACQLSSIATVVGSVESMETPAYSEADSKLPINTIESAVNPAVRLAVWLSAVVPLEPETFMQLFAVLAQKSGSKRAIAASAPLPAGSLSAPVGAEHVWGAPLTGVALGVAR